MVGPVGRLDKASEGFLLLTNDSEWAARLSDPDSHVDKIYHVHAGVKATDSIPDLLRKGVPAGGELLRAKQARVLRAGEKNSWLEIVLDEGKNRQIRRMFQSLGIEILQLIRVTIGPLALGQLAKGRYRALTPGEKSALDFAVKSRRNQTRMPDKRRAGTAEGKTDWEPSRWPIKRLPSVAMRRNNASASRSLELFIIMLPPGAKTKPGSRPRWPWRRAHSANLPPLRRTERSVKASTSMRPCQY